MINKQAVADCLSKAIVDVAEWEFNRLKEGMSDVEVAQAVEGALKSLKGLASGRMPYYGDWTALFYLTWHHPNHVNLAYSMIVAMLQKSKRRLPSNLYVLDFGCGTLATQFGLALAISDLRGEQPVKSVRICQIDDSEPMVRLGKKTWDRFGELAGENADLTALSDAMNSITRTDGPPVCGDECWLSAMHVVYQKNHVAVKKALALRENQIRPHVGFITSHYDLNSRSLAHLVSPFGNKRGYLHRPNLERVNPIFNGGLTEVTKWRWGVKAGILKSLPAGAASNLPLITDKGYLDRFVSWQWRDAACRVYTRIE